MSYFSNCRRGGGVGTLIFTYIRVGAGNFLGFKILKFRFISGFQTNEYFLGMNILWIFLGGHHKMRLYIGVISMHFWVFFKAKVQNGVFLGLLKFQIFLVVLEIPGFFFCVFILFYCCFLKGGG